MRCKYLTRFLLIITFFLSGCTGQYDLKISGTKLDEKIVMNIYDYDHNVRQYEEAKIDMAEEFINKDYYAFFEDYNQLYIKTLEKKDNYTKVTLKYDFNMDNFENSNYIKTCFQNSKIKNKEKYYQIELTGYFYCLYGEQLDIRVMSHNKVLSNNANQVKGNKYIWHIDKSNYQNVDIGIKLEKESFAQKISNYTLPIVILFIVLVSIITITIIKIKEKKHNQI